MLDGDSIVVAGMERAMDSLCAPSQYAARSSEGIYSTAVVGEGVTAKAFGSGNYFSRVCGMWI